MWKEGGLRLAWARSIVQVESLLVMHPDHQYIRIAFEF